MSEFTKSQLFLIQKIEKILTSNPFSRPIFIIHGLTGVGKTFLAKEYCSMKKCSYVFAPKEPEFNQMIRIQGFTDFIRKYEEINNKVGSPKHHIVFIDGIDGPILHLMNNQLLGGILTSISRDIPENFLFIMVKTKRIGSRLTKGFPTERFLLKNWPQERLFSLQFTLDDLKHIAKSKNLYSPNKVDPERNAFALYPKI